MTSKANTVAFANPPFFGDPVVVQVKGSSVTFHK